MKNKDNYDTSWYELIKRQIKEKMLFELRYYYNDNFEIIGFERLVNSLKSIDLLDESEYMQIYNECIKLIMED